MKPFRKTNWRHLGIGYPFLFAIIWAVFYLIRCIGD